MSKTVVVVCEYRSLKGVAEGCLCESGCECVSGNAACEGVSLSRKLLFLKQCVCV